MGERTTYPAVTFEQFSEMNRRRCESYNGFHESLQPDSKFTLGDWARMIASEAGEVCDATLGWEGKKERRAGKTLEDIAEELADLITLCDLAIQKTGHDTVDVLVRKFNEVNKRNGYGKRFDLGLRPEPPTPPETPGLCRLPRGHEGPHFNTEGLSWSNPQNPGPYPPQLQPIVPVSLACGAAQSPTSGAREGCDGRCRALGCWEPCSLSWSGHAGACNCGGHAGATGKLGEET